VRLQAYHVPGVENILADRLSRLPTERQVPLMINKEWIISQVFPIIGSPHLDLFATYETSLAPLWVSRRWEKRAWATNAFALDWAQLPHRVWLFPPPILIPRILQRLPWTPTDFWIVVPLWPSHAWFPQLWEAMSDWPLLLPDLPGLFSEGVRWPMIVCNISGSLYRRQAFREKLRKASWEDSVAQLDRLMPSGERLPSSFAARDLMTGSLARLISWNF
jgi:hypothetical protein